MVRAVDFAQWNVEMSLDGQWDAVKGKIQSRASVIMNDNYNDDDDENKNVRKKTSELNYRTDFV